MKPLFFRSDYLAFVKEAHALKAQNKILALVERACNKIGVVHVQQSVLYRVAVVVKNKAHRLSARVACADVRSAVVAALFDNVRDV